jgi:N-acetylglucosaminyldiphosphoundecaprenol N-acetyl-beta-D-mannosaminyltransferase
MINGGRKNVLGVLVGVLDYEGVVEHVARAVLERRSVSISALAVHGIMTGVFDQEHKHRLNSLSLVVPDGQPVRWALNLLYKSGLKQRCYGPNLTLYLCKWAAKEHLPVFFYGATSKTLQGIRTKLASKFPELEIAGMEPSKFRRLTPKEKIELAERIRKSGAGMAFIGLGCPRQEVFLYEFKDLLPMPILAVGAAFPFMAGEIAQAPDWIQEIGMEWFFRLCVEPGRLWRRYVILNPVYLILLILQMLGLHSFNAEGVPPRSELRYG